MPKPKIVECLKQPKDTVLQSISLIMDNLLGARKLFSWYTKSKCAPPALHFVKQAVLLRHGTKDCAWIETGTHIGLTTKLLSSRYREVHTIEPSEKLITVAKKNVGNASNVIFYHGSSEEYLKIALSSVAGDVCMWLDGHYSGEGTFKGDLESPIIFELGLIEEYLHRFKSAVVMIDDIRCSHLDPQNYPSLDFYVRWANRNNLNWIIEHDSFIAKTKELPVYP
jgi:hypothetical protein